MLLDVWEAHANQDIYILIRLEIRVPQRKSKVYATSNDIWKSEYHSVSQKDMQHLLISGNQSTKV